MKKASNIWVRRGLLLHRLHGQELALALLLKQKPMSAPQICSSLLEKEIRFDRKKIGKLLADLEWWGVSLTIVVYIAANVLCWITVKRAITRAC